MAKDDNSKEQQETKILKCGKRTYFFDIKIAKNDAKYLRVSESWFVKEGEPRKRNTITLFPQDVEGFLNTLSQVQEELH